MPIKYLPQFSDADLFQLVNIVLPAWALLMLMPAARITKGVVTLVASLLSLLYVLLLVTTMMDSDAFGMKEMFTYEGVVKLLSNKATALPAWVHFAAFDL